MTRPANEALIEYIGLLKAMLINVATGERRIQDAETEYTQLRAKVATEFQSLGIKDPNQFHSLWDWYSYWRSNSLATYQSRRDFVSSLYKPVLESLEQTDSPVEQSLRTPEQFSVRHGYAARKITPPIVIREEAPVHLRCMIMDIAAQTGWDYDDLFDLAASFGKRSWESPDPKHVGISSVHNLHQLMFRWEWFRVYDFIEHIYAQMLSW